MNTRPVISRESLSERKRSHGMILFNLLSVLFVLSVFHFQEIASQEDVVSIRLNRPGTKKACGVVDHKGSLIVNGTDVKPGDYPWMVALMEKKDLRGDNKYFCSGVLVSLTKVLTGEIDSRKYYVISTQKI